MHLWEHCDMTTPVPPEGAGLGAQAGDVGRRVAYRREELGLSREQLAERAGLSPDYLRYVEAHAAQVAAGTLLRLAAALDTSPAQLLGHGVGQPPGHGGAATHPVLDVLDAAQCVRLLAAGGIGRVVVVDEHRPAAFPVNFAMLANDIVFRTSPTSVLTHADGQIVGFEVDRIDDAMREGWSVLTSGPAHRVEDAGGLTEVQALGIRPWAGGERDVYFRLTPGEWSGRQIRTN
jgi:transcriptional regulator with XRE-family HTH domain